MLWVKKRRRTSAIRLAFDFNYTILLLNDIIRVDLIRERGTQAGTNRYVYVSWRVNKRQPPPVLREECDEEMGSFIGLRHLEDKPRGLEN